MATAPDEGGRAAGPAAGPADHAANEAWGTYKGKMRIDPNVFLCTLTSDDCTTPK